MSSLCDNFPSCTFRIYTPFHVYFNINYFLKSPDFTSKSRLPPSLPHLGLYSKRASASSCLLHKRCALPIFLHSGPLDATHWLLSSLVYLRLIQVFKPVFFMFSKLLLPTAFWMFHGYLTCNTSRLNPHPPPLSPKSPSSSIPRPGK